DPRAPGRLPRRQGDRPAHGEAGPPRARPAPTRASRGPSGGPGFTVTAPRTAGSGGSPGASVGGRVSIVVGLAVILGIVGLQILDDSGGGSSDATVPTVPGVPTT